ncbi:sulfite oxidase [Virgisporangium aliadipatigenens]|uniref:Sulfite oxidase n=1 Tax=Virgisporangium aliadipatigenens TaxID=741659 RepID=A0A8J4DQA0_9ACTN|nr:sulfite oxidase [Virgisporangium aliadipatigenens]GIJ45192.1 sulfite oxidase [Virgisporangium aliadipatigenens]
MDEREYDSARLSQWRAGVASGFSRRDLARLAVGVSAVALGVGAAPAAARADGPIVKPLPPEWFTIRGTNAEMRWEALADQGYLVPVDRFFVRNHTSTPIIDGSTWRLELFGSGLRAPASLSLRDLKRLPSTELVSAVECAGNGRSFYTGQQGQTVSGTAWTLGAIGVARWRGVRLSTVLRRAGITRDAVDVQPEGLDPNFVTGGVDLGRVRRPLPVAKALDDVLLAYEMNGEPLPPDHGYPVRVIVPGWIGIASIKWVGRIEVSATPLFSPWNTQFYRLFGPAYPAEGTLVSRQVVKSAFELPWNATLAAGRRHVLRGRSWSGNGPVRHVEVSTDGGATWRRARAVAGGAWQRWEYPWRPAAPGAYTLRARATDVTGASQPAVAEFNTQGYLFDAVVAHPVTVG